MQAEVFEHLAACLEYPTSESATRASAAADLLGDTALAGPLSDLAEWLGQGKPGEAEERYTQLFDLKPVATLNLTHHLLGDTYQRGALLAGLAHELDGWGLGHRHDLPDYLPTLLRLLARLGEEDRRLLTHAVILPGLEKVNTALAESPGPWPAVLRALSALLNDAVPKGDEEIPVPRRPLEVLPCSI